MLRRNIKLGAMNFKGEYRKDVAKRHAIAEARAIGGSRVIPTSDGTGVRHSCRRSQRSSTWHIR